MKGSQNSHSQISHGTTNLTERFASIFAIADRPGTLMPVATSDYISQGFHFLALCPLRLPFCAVFTLSILTSLPAFHFPLSLWFLFLAAAFFRHWRRVRFLLTTAPEASTPLVSNHHVVQNPNLCTHFRSTQSALLRPRISSEFQVATFYDVMPLNLCSH